MYLGKVQNGHKNVCQDVVEPAGSRGSYCVSGRATQSIDQNQMNYGEIFISFGDQNQDFIKFS